MNFVNLKYFLVVVQEMSFSKAAQKLYLSQQALSGHIRRLESECGTPLFERNPKLRLTYAGTCVARLASQIIDLETQMSSQLSDIANLRSGHLSIGASQTRGRVFFPEILPTYVQRYPNVELTMHAAITSTLESMLLDGELDLMLGFLPFSNDLIESVPLINERLCIVVPHKIMADKFPSPRNVAAHFTQHGADISVFADQPFLMLKQGRARDMAFRYMSKCRISPHVILEYADLETLLALCFHGMGLTFTYESFAKKALIGNEQITQGNTYIFPLNDAAFETKLAIAYHKERYLSKAASDFIMLAQELFPILPFATPQTPPSPFSSI